MATIKVDGATKRFGDNTVFENISCGIEEGKIYGLFGNNGAGKTTLLNIMSNKLFLTDGQVTLDGEVITENDAALSKIFIMSEKTFAKQDVKVKDLFAMTQIFYKNFDMIKAKKLAEEFELKLNKKYQTLSTGYRSIVKMVLAFSSGAEVLIFDEPILGLDARHRDMFYKQVIKEYQDRQPTIILSTHIIEEIAELIEKVIILHNHKILLNDDVEKVLQSYYSVSGRAKDVEDYARKYVKEEELIYTEEMTGFKRLTVKGKPQEADNLEFGGIELQKLFIHLTNKGEGK